MPRDLGLPSLMARGMKPAAGGDVGFLIKVSGNSARRFITPQHASVNGAAPEIGYSAVT